MTPTTIPAITGGQIEKFAPADRITLAVTGAVSGGNLVELTADNQVGQCATDASTAVFGVALHDAAGVGTTGASASEWSTVTVATEGVWVLAASGAVSAGGLVVATTSGKVKPAGATGVIVGVALAAIGATGTGPVKLRI